MKSCPNCGADVPSNAKACPECGSDENTGWSETAYASGLDLPPSDEDFNYNEYVKKEFSPKRTMSHGIHLFWWVVAVVLLIAMLGFLF